MEKIKLSSPWMTFFHEMQALFDSDPDVTVRLKEGDDTAIEVYVCGAEKSEALEALLPASKTFGNVTVYINVIPDNPTEEKRKIDLFKTAFFGNPVVSYITTNADPFQNKVDYIVFQNKVVQFFNDDISDVNGNMSTLYEEIARDVFDDAGVFFCTDVEKEFS